MTCIYLSPILDPYTHSSVDHNEGFFLFVIKSILANREKYMGGTVQLIFGQVNKPNGLQTFLYKKINKILHCTCGFLYCSLAFGRILVLPATGLDKAGNFSQRSPRLTSHLAINFPLLQVARRPASTTWKPNQMCGHICAENLGTQSILTLPGKILAENHASFEFKFQTMIGTQVLLLSSPTRSL